MSLMHLTVGRLHTDGDTWHRHLYGEVRLETTVSVTANFKKGGK